MAERVVGVLGATSLVGQCLVSLLAERGWRVWAFSRREVENDRPGVEWHRIRQNNVRDDESADERPIIPFWLCAAPIWVLPEYFAMLKAHGASRVIAVSSTSRFTKAHSSDPDEANIAYRLAKSEERLTAWARSEGMDWVIFRPTLIYGLGRDQNISEIVRVIRRLGFFPLLGQARGLRQPVHAEDVALACISALDKDGEIKHAYNLSGGETLTYREMVCRVFAAMDRKPCLPVIPLWVLRPVIFLLRRLPRFRKWTVQMAERMNEDMVFDHHEAAGDFHYSPRSFRPDTEDMPP